MAKKKGGSKNKNILQRLLDIESEARERIENAREEADEIIEKAEKDAQSILNEAQEDANTEADKIVREADESASEKKTRGFSGQNFEDIESFRKRAGENLDRAAAFLVNWVTGKEEKEEA